MLNRLTAKIFYLIFHKKLLKNIKDISHIDINNSKAKFNHQYTKLTEVVKLAKEKIPFYREVLKDVDVSSLSYSDFCRLPFLTKDIIRSQKDLLTNDSYLKKSEVHKHSSGGSTGEPVIFYRTEDQTRFGLASYYYALDNNNVKFLSKSVDLWGAERDMYKKNTRLDFRSIVHNKRMLNTFVLSDEIIRSYIDELNKIKPLFIKAYVHSVYEIAKFINSNNINISFRPTIHCTTGPLYEEAKEEIKKAFNNAHVYNFYGSREVSAIASQNSEESELFVLFDNVFVEILDKEGMPVNNGEEGEVVVTTLNNFYMPLIRYKIGDRAVKGDDHVFGTLMLKQVTGRTLGVVHRKDGVRIDGQFFTTLFFSKKGIKNFQIVQKSLDHVVVNIVKSDYFDPSELDEVIKRIGKELFEPRIEIVFKDKIELTSTGKIMYVYSELN